MNNLTKIRKVKSDKKVIAFYIFLALIPFFSELTRLIVYSLNPVGFAEAIISRIEEATGTICLIPAYIFVAPLGLLFTLVPLLFIKVARAIFIKDKRYSYAAIGAIFCYNIFVKDFLEQTRYLIQDIFGLRLHQSDYAHIKNISDIVALIIAPVFICLLFYLSQIIVRPDAGKKHVFKHIFLGITITAAPALLIIGGNLIYTVLRNILYSFGASYYVTNILYNILWMLMPPIFAIWVLFMSTVAFRDLRAGLIAIACYSIPYTIATSLISIVSDLVYSLSYDYDVSTIVQAVSSLVLVLAAVIIAFLYYLLKILLPYIKIRKKALANKIPDSISDSLSEAENPEYTYFNEQTNYFDEQTQYFDEQTQYFDEQTGHFDEQPQYYAQSQYNSTYKK